MDVARRNDRLLKKAPGDYSTEMRNPFCLSLLLLVACTFRVFISGEQKFLEQPQLYQEVSIGDDVRLRCIVRDKGGQCIWQKDGELWGMRPGKYEWANDHDVNDCTILIRRANLYVDDALWQCRVTPSFNRQDGLSSHISRLLVRAKPKDPQLEYLGTVQGATLMLKEGQEVMISCVSRHGNPPANIKWFIGKKEVNSVTAQTNVTEANHPKTWMARSLLRVRGERINHGQPIRCVTMHPASLTPISTETQLNIHYSPEVRLETNPRPLTAAPEDSVSFLNLECLADANPAPSIKWFKDSVLLDTPLTNTTSPPSPTQGKMMLVTDSISMWSAELHFKPITRQDAGLYSCIAMNIVGESQPASYGLDVQYGPKLKSTDEKNKLKVEQTTLLGSSAVPFECPEFDTNPPAQYRWVRFCNNTTEMIEGNVQSSFDRRLHLENITWSDEGEYCCIAFNTINGVRRETINDRRYVLYVTGAPEIQARPLPGGKDFFESVGWTGEPVHRLKSRFCSRPPPKLVAWQWGSSHIRAGENIHQKYEALPLESIVQYKMVSNCYWAKLDIKNLRKEDGRMYTLLVESEKGQDSTSIKLIVRDPTENHVVAANVAVGLLFLSLVISISVYLLLKMRGRCRQKMEENSGIAAEVICENSTSMNRSINSSDSETFAMKSDLDGDQGINDSSNIAK